MMQLRGEKLKNALREGIYALADKADKAGKTYVYNASELSRLIGPSRVTLKSHSDFVDEVLKELKAERRMRTGKAMQQHLLDRNERLETMNKALEREVNTLRTNHAEMFTKLLGSSKDLASLVASYVETVKDGKCLLCNSVVSEQKEPRHYNVVGLEEIKEKQKQRKKEENEKYEEF